MSSHSKSHGKLIKSSLHTRDFPFKVGDLVLVKWSDGMVYFAKIKRIDHKRRKCTVVFDDKSQDEAHFSQIHSVDETTTDIICIKCKKDDSESPNEIVLCDTCGIGYHQKCHSPSIPTSALNIDTPWQCTYCSRGEKCPYLTESLDVLQNLLSEESGSESEKEERAVQPEPKTVGSTAGTRRSRRVNEGKVNSDLRSPRPPPPSLEMRPSGLPNIDAVRHKLAAPLPVTQSTKHVTTPHTLATPPVHTSPDSENMYTPESTPESTPEPISSDRKRKKTHSHKYRKKQKQSSMDICTLSVTRLPAPQDESSPPNDPPAILNGIDLVSDSEPRPRSLRVSLSIEDNEGSVKIRTPGTSAKSTPQNSPPMPCWEENNEEQMNTEEQEKDIFPTVSLERKSSVILQTGKTDDKSIITDPEAQIPTESSHAFTASSLPSSTSPQPTSPTSPRQSSSTTAAPSPPTAVSTLPPTVSTQPPPVSTLPPTVSTQPPAVSTLPPAVSTLPPAVSTQPPAVSTLPPAVSTLPPAVSTQPPPVSTLPPAVSTLPPVVSTLPPAVSTLPPAVSTLPPAVSTLPPAVSTQPPPVSTLPPAVSTQPPPVSTLPPAVSTLPPTVSSKPTVVSPKSTTAPSHPNVPFIQPATTPPKPSTTTPQLSVTVIPDCDFDSIDDMFEMSPRESTEPSAPCPLTSQDKSAVEKNKMVDKPPDRIDERVSVVKSPLSSGSKPQPSLHTTTTSHVDGSDKIKPVSALPTNSPQLVSSDTLTTSAVTKPETHSKPSSLAVHTPASKVSTSHQASTPQPTKLNTPNVIRAPLASPLAIHTATTKPRTVLVSTPSASLAHTPLLPTKRSLSEDVIITCVERSAPPTKKPNIDTTESKTESQVARKAIAETPIATRPPQRTTSYSLASQTTPVVLETNKPQYVYCVQSAPGGKPMYIPASVIQQAHPQAKDATVMLTPHTKPTNSPLYYTSEVVQSAPVNTTKPYAIVNALPSTGGMSIYPRHFGIGGEGVGPILMAGSPMTDKRKKVTHTPPPPPPVTYPKSGSPASEELTSHLQTINKNISAAFTSSNEDLLISAFEDAWKKFQANGFKYKGSSKVISSRSHGPPNAEVVTIPGTVASKLSLVRPVGQRSRPVAPKVNRTCALCGREATYLCSGCRTEWYCGRECQLKAWDRHSEACKS